MFVHTVMTERGPLGRGVGSPLMREAEWQSQAASAPALHHWAGSDELGRIHREYGYTTPWANTTTDRPAPRSATSCGCSTC